MRLLMVREMGYEDSFNETMLEMRRALKLALSFPRIIQIITENATLELAYRKKDSNMRRSLTTDILRLHLLIVVTFAIIGLLWSFALAWQKSKHDRMERVYTLSQLIENRIHEDELEQKITTYIRNKDAHGLRVLLEPIVWKILVCYPKDFSAGFFSKDLDQVVVGLNRERTVNFYGYKLKKDDPGVQSWSTGKPVYATLWRPVRKAWFTECNNPVIIDGKVIGHTYANSALFDLVELDKRVGILSAMGTLVATLISVFVGRTITKKIKKNLDRLRIHMHVPHTLPEFDYEEFYTIAKSNNDALIAISKAQKRHSAILEHFPWGYAIIDDTGNYVDMNVKGAEILESTRDCLLNRQTKYWEAQDSPLYRALKEKIPVEAEYTTEVSGQVKSLYVNAFPIPLGETSDGVMVWFVDLTERKKMEADLRQMDRLGTIGEMLSVVAHDIRNPLTAIKSKAQLAYLMPDKVSHVQEWRKVDLLVDNAVQYLNRLLSFSKPSNETLLSCCNLKDMFNNVMALLHGKIGYSKVSVKEEIAESLPNVRVNPLDFQYVLLNLINNAYEAIENTGTITFKAKSVDNSVLVQIEDTGIGISPDNLDRIWLMFYTSKENGTGLGLSMAKKVIEHCGGTISVSSRLGQGTVFTIQLPSDSDTFVQGAV